MSTFEPGATAGDPSLAQPLPPVIAVAAAADIPPRPSAGLEQLSQ
jgi:hypothetical protein